MSCRTSLLITSMIALPALALLALRPTAAQAAGWSGWARCELKIELKTQRTGYLQTETHTWMVTNATGNTPATWGSGTWHVSGPGQLDESDSVTTTNAKWAINGNSTAAQFAVVPIAGGGVSIRPVHTPLGTPGGIAGYTQQTINGSVRLPVTISDAADEWTFPVVQGPAASPTLSGSAPGMPLPGWGTLRPTGSTMTVSCTWLFANGSTPPPPPAVPPVPPPPLPGSQPPPQQPPPSDPCARPTRTSESTTITGLVPRSFREGERITVCGSQLSMAVLEDRYADSAEMPSLASPNTATFVLIGNRSLMAVNPEISKRGDRIVFTAGRLYERSELSKDYDVLIPVAPVPKIWTGEFALRLKGGTEPVRGPPVRWNAR